MTLHDTFRRDAPLDDDKPPLRPPRSGYSMRLAMIVPGIGVVILGLFIGAEFLTSNPVQPTKVSTHSFTVPGTPLRAVPAVKALKVITVSGQPPGNIINSSSIPQGAQRTSFENNTNSAQEYDAQITLKINQSQAAVENFYRKDLKKQGWQIFSTGPAKHVTEGLEVLAKKAGSDGFYWEMGVVISPTSFGGNAPAAGTTSFTVEMLQEPDPGS
jgi:hypothetical protein